MARKPAKRKANLKTATLPKGYEAITGFAASWAPEDEPLLEGTILDFGEVESQYKDDKGRKKMQRTCTLERKDGTVVTIWESATLKGLFEECEEGEKIAIAFQGFGKAKKGQSAPKLFAVGYK